VGRNIKIILLSAGITTAAFLFISWRRKAANVAARFIGINEIGNNQGFSNAVFQQMMKEVGWQSGESWCMYLAKAIYLKAFPKKAAAIGAILTPSTQQSWKNVKAHPEMFIVLDKPTDKPHVGDLVFWQSTTNAANGHVGIVDHVPNSQTIEGNTSEKGVREGQGVRELTRKLVPGSVEGTLKLLGFARLKNSLLG
jgi:hypothetical protein